MEAWRKDNSGEAPDTLTALQSILRRSMDSIVLFFTHTAGKYGYIPRAVFAAL